MIAIDFSMNSAGVVIGNTDKPEELKMLCFRQRKRDESLSKNIKIVDYPIDPKNNEERYFEIANSIMGFIDKNNINNREVYIEDYSFGSTGSVFNIAEATATLKHILWMSGFNITKISPKSIKKYATGSGNATKTDMYNTFIDKTGFDFNKVLIGPKKDIEKGDEKIPSPVSDLIDAYFLLQYGLHEQANLHV